MAVLRYSLSQVLIWLKIAILIINGGDSDVSIVRGNVCT